MFPFRIGTTSYILPDDILPNVRFLADRVEDVELVLFEVDEGASNLPSPQVVRELGRIGKRSGLSYTVHLPLDLVLSAADGERHASMVKAKKVIERTRALEPWVYVLHLDGQQSGLDGDWVSRAASSLWAVSQWAGGPEKLAVENLEGYPPGLIDPVLQEVPASRCVDVGHLWLDGQDPIPYLERSLNRTRVVHIHGVAKRDHSSLEHVDRAELERVAQLLVQRQFKGVLTIEVFSWADLHTSLERLRGLETRR